jgi:diguanylate cyclase (GGDEF)-like protein
MKTIHFRSLSIRHKLMLIILLVSGVVLLLSSIAFITNDLITLHKIMKRNLEVQTRIIGVNAAPLVFFEGTEEETTQMLNSLSEHEDIALAQVYKKGDVSPPYATYKRDKISPELLGNFEQLGFVSSADFLQFSQPLYALNDEYVGIIVLMLDRRQLYIRVQQYIGIALIIIFIAILIALLLSAKLQRIITEPILMLVDLTRRVSVEKNYNLRAQRQTQDELSILFEGFNEMLEAIQERDNQLERHRENLEKTVATRTAELRKLNLKLTYQAYHDALTNLPNRALFIKRIEQAISYAEQNGELLSVLFIDLDRFKYINDTLGHAAGDLLLQEISKRLLACTRQPEDTVARLGGDEFTLLLRNIKDPRNAGVVAEHIMHTLTEPLYYNQQSLYITPSIGISVYPRDGKDVGSLMKNADASMYVAKNMGRNNYQFYTLSANASSATRLNMENRLRHALEYQEFEVWYQPRFKVNTGQIVGAEALVRWRSPDNTLVSPAQFIPLAEDTGLIIPIGAWVLRTACHENLGWQREGELPIHVSVNLSARQFVQEDLLADIELMIEELQINPRCLELELTESSIMPNAEDTIETLQALKKQGIGISVDDFGTGYSSLSYLKRFPIDILKIDQSFIRDISVDSDGNALVTAIIAMAHNLKLQVVAEGVETYQQLNFLRQHHCDYAQGFLFGKAVPAQEFRAMLKNPPFLQENNEFANLSLSLFEDFRNPSF